LLGINLLTLLHNQWHLMNCLRVLDFYGGTRLLHLLIGDVLALVRLSRV
jgi:hypothetical protein